MSRVDRCLFSLGIVTLAVAFAVPCAAGDVYRCKKQDGPVEYRDSPCDQAAPAIRSVGPEKTGRFKPGESLPVTAAVVRECYDAYRGYARDPTASRMLSANPTVPKSGIPIVVVSAIFVNKYGGPDNMQLWCRLTDDLRFDRTATEDSINRFRESQDEAYAGLRDLQRKIDREMKRP